MESMVGGELLILDNIIARMIGIESGTGTLELVNTIAIAIILIVSVLSLYYSKFQGAKIRAIEVQEQTPLSSAYHTIIFTNYGNKTGVVIGPKIVGEEKIRIEDAGEPVIAIKPRDTVISKIEVYSNISKNFNYHIEYRDPKGNVIKLPTHTYIGKIEKKRS